jgi:transposase
MPVHLSGGGAGGHVAVPTSSMPTRHTTTHRRCRRECRARGIVPRIARRGIDSSERLGRHRWKVERTLAWIAQFRRLAVRHERRADVHLALTTLACAIIRMRQVRRFCPRP